MQKALSIATTSAPDQTLVWLRWEQNQPRVRWRPGVHRDPRLERLIAAAGTHRPHDVRRVRTRDVEELFYTPLPEDDADFYDRWAAELNFGHGETLPYRAHPVALVNRGTAQLWLNRDMLGVDEPVQWPRPVLRCLCGQLGAVGAATCHGCGGLDPLGSFLSQHRKALESALIEATNSALNAVPPLAAGQALLEALRALPRPSQPIRTGKESTPDYARRLIPWINATLSLPGITPTLAEAFHIGLKDKTAAIGRAEELAVTVRRWWQPNQSTGWAPTDAHKEAVAETSSATWANTAAALATLASAYKAGCLAYLPVRSVLQRKPRPRRVHDRAQNAPPPHRHVHRLWSGVEELATTAEERDCMESFSEQFSRLRSQLETATAVLNVALEEALNTNANQQHAAYAYLRMMVLEDYAATPLSERQAWVRRLAASLDVPFKSPKPGLKARGSTVWRWLGALSTAAGSVAWFFLP